MTDPARKTEILPSAPDDVTVAAKRDPDRDTIVYPIKRTPGKSILFDFLDQNLKSAQFRKLLHEGS